MNSRVVQVLCIFLFFQGSQKHLIAEGGIWTKVDTTLTFSSSISLDASRAKTLEVCRQQALENVIPLDMRVYANSQLIELERSEYSEESFAVSSFIVSFNAGFILDEKFDSSPEIDIEANIIRYRAAYKANVLPQTRNRDPSLKLTFDARDGNLEHGDNLVFDCETSVDGYLYILHFFADNTVELFYPNFYMQDNYLEAGKTHRIPENKAIRIRVAADPEYEMTVETFYAVLCTRPVPGLDEAARFEPSAIAHTAGDESYSHFQRWLSEIPISMRTEALTQIRIFQVE